MEDITQKEVRNVYVALKERYQNFREWREGVKDIAKFINGNIESEDRFDYEVEGSMEFPVFLPDSVGRDKRVMGTFCIHSGKFEIHIPNCRETTERYITAGYDGYWYAADVRAMTEALIEFLKGLSEIPSLEHESVIISRLVEQINIERNR